MVFDFSIVDENIRVYEDSKNEIKEEVENEKKQFLKMDNKKTLKSVRKTVENLLKIEAELNDIFIEREDEIRMLTLAFISGSNGFFHGPAGTGKSALVEEYSSRIKRANYFRILMGKTTEPGEIFGPVSINAMKNDIYKVNTKNKLPEANISFIDEIFKANSAVLNNLLSIMNEKVFLNDTVKKVPLISLIGASNEYYEDDSLIALYDRFLLRWNMDYIKEPSNRIELFKRYLKERGESSPLCKFGEVKSYTTINIEDLIILNEKVKAVTIDAKVLNTYNKLISTLLKKNIIISDRRKNESLKVIQGAALLDGRYAAEVEDLDVLKYTFWSNEDDINLILEEVNKLSNPNKNKLNNMKKAFNDYKKQIDEIEENKDSSQYAFDKTMAATEIMKNINYALNTISGILTSMKNEGKDKSKDYIEFESFSKEMKSYAEYIKKEITL